MTDSRITRVLVIDPSFLFYQGVFQSLASSPFQVVGWAQDGEGAIAHCKTNGIDLALIGHGFGEREGLELCRVLRTQLGEMRIILLSEHAASALFQADAACAGASACLLASVSREEFLAALEPIANGTRLLSTEVRSQTAPVPHLTEREVEILKQVADGKTDKEIAQALHISVHTVRNHVQNISRKLEVNDRETAVWRARHRNLI